MMLDNEPQVVEKAEMSETDAVEMLKAFCKNGFHGSYDEAGLVLGRPVEELQRMIDGIEPVDEDLIMKMRGIAMQRGIDVGIQIPDGDEDEPVEE